MPLRLILIVLLLLWFWRIYNRVRARAAEFRNRTSETQAPTGDAQRDTLSDQEISDADYEEIP